VPPFFFTSTFFFYSFFFTTNRERLFCVQKQPAGIEEEIATNKFHPGSQRIAEGWNKLAKASSFHTERVFSA
jgi:hypothetical protein